MDSNVCLRFERIINDEIAAGEYSLDITLIRALKNTIITDEGKISMGIPIEKEVTIYDLTKDAVTSLSKMRFIYLISLFEAFAQEYIAERKSIKVEDLKENLKFQASNWAKQTRNASTSYYNFKYVNFLFKELFSIDFSNHVNAITLEGGDIRKCIVHHNGLVCNDYMKDHLKETLKFLGLNQNVGEKIEVTKKIMGIFIEDFRKIIDLCKY